jgi:hypothetical protein
VKRLRNLFRLKGSNGQHAEGGVRATRCFTTATSERRRCSSVISAKRRLSPKLQKETFGVPQPERRTCMEISVRDERYPLDRLTSPGNDPCIGPAVGMQFPSTRVQIGLSPLGIILFRLYDLCVFREIDCPPGRLDFLSFGFPRTERRLRMAAAVRSRCAPTALQGRPRMISN